MIKSNHEECFEYNSSKLILGNYNEVLRNTFNINLIVTSPPYNIGSNGIRQDGYRKIGKYDPKSFSGILSYEDKMQETVYQDSQSKFIIWAMEHLSNDGVLLYNHKNRLKNKSTISPYEWILPLVKAKKISLRQEIIWNRRSTHNHDKNYLYPISEKIFVIHKPNAKIFFRNYDPEGDKKGIGDVIEFKWQKNKKIHDASFPIELPNTFINMFSRENDLICDPFSGSGTTMIAAIQAKRNFIGSELNEEHYKNSKERVLNYFLK